MSKYYGSVGFAVTVEKDTDIFVEEIIEREYIGDVLKNRRTIQSASAVNYKLAINNRISILADPYAFNNFHSIRYATYMGSKWEITGVSVEYPRLILELGGLYNETTSE